MCGVLHIARDMGIRTFINSRYVRKKFSLQQDDVARYLLTRMTDMSLRCVSKS